MSLLSLALFVLVYVFGVASGVIVCCLLVLVMVVVVCV